MGCLDGVAEIEVDFAAAVVVDEPPFLPFHLDQKNSTQRSFSGSEQGRRHPSLELESEDLKDRLHSHLQKMGKAIHKEIH